MKSEESRLRFGGGCELRSQRGVQVLQEFELNGGPIASRRNAAVRLKVSSSSESLEIVQTRRTRIHDPRNHESHIRASGPPKWIVVGDEEAIPVQSLLTGEKTHTHIEVKAEYKHEGELRGLFGLRRQFGTAN